MNYVPKEREKFSAKKMSPHLSQLSVAMAHRNYLRQKKKSANPQIGNIYKD